MRVETLPEYVRCLGMNLHGMIEKCDAVLEESDNAAVSSLKSELKQLNDLVNEMALKFCSGEAVS